MFLIYHFNMLYYLEFDVSILFIRGVIVEIIFIAEAYI